MCYKPSPWSSFNFDFYCHYENLVNISLINVEQRLVFDELLILFDLILPKPQTVPSCIQGLLFKIGMF